MKFFAFLLLVIIFFTIFVLVKNHIRHDFSNITYERIVFIPGIKTPVWAVSGWKWYLEYHFPTKEIVLIRDNYHYKNKEDMIRLKNKFTDIVSDNISTAVITHSYGGIVTVAGLQADQDNSMSIERVIALAPPFDPDFSDLFVSQEQIGYTRKELSAPMVTMCGIFDTVVPCKSTVFPNARQGKKIISEHMMFLLPQLFGGGKILKEMK